MAFTVSVDTNKTRTADSELDSKTGNRSKRVHTDEDSVEEPLIFQELERHERWVSHSYFLIASCCS